MLLNKVMSRLSSFRSGLNGSRMMCTDVSEKSMNQITLLGRVGMDPQKRGSEHTPVVIFSLATTTKYKGANETTHRTDWHRISVFKPHLRDTVYDYVKKGHRVLVNGRLSYGKIQDDKGNEQIMSSIIADDVIMFSS